MDYKKLLQNALQAKKRAYAPYSNFRVGSAVLTKTGKIFSGCNIETSSYSLTICAERTALFKAISEGEKSFQAIAIVSDEKGFTTPCGACRQVILDLAGDIDIILMSKTGKTKIYKSSAMLPHAFGPKNLKQGIANG